MHRVRLQTLVYLYPPNCSESHRQPCPTLLASLRYL